MPCRFARALPFVLSGLVAFGGGPRAAPAGDASWLQLQGNSLRSGDASDRDIELPLGLVAAVPLSDSVFTAPVVRDGRIWVVDGSAVAWCIELSRSEARVLWKRKSGGGPLDVNNVSSPALVGRYLHFGTMAGVWHVLDAATGDVVRRIDCGEPILSSAVAGGDRVWFATLGSRVFALEGDGRVAWRWDYAREVLGFEGDRWSGADWLRRGHRVTWRDQFCASRDGAAFGRTLVVPTGGTVTWLADRGDRATREAIYRGPDRRESPSTLALSIGEDGRVYRQWTRRDNGGSIDVLRRDGKEVAHAALAGTATSYRDPGSISFSSVAIRGGVVYRTRPEEGFGLVRHREGKPPEPLSPAGSVAPPLLLRRHALFGGLDGRLHVVELEPSDARRTDWTWSTPFGRAITAPLAVTGGRVIFGGEDGYLYVLGPKGSASPPTRRLGIEKIRSPLPESLRAAARDWPTSFGDFANTNRGPDSIRPPVKLRWVRRYAGTVKHFSVTGGGRLYTHTAEGQVLALEEDTGRLLWRRWFPGVHVSYTSPVYHDERLWVPQAGLERSRLRCLDAATGELLWEAPFTGSPSWNRQMPPIVWKDLVIYLFSSGRYTARGWLFEHQSTFGFPADQKPLVRAWNRATGDVVWTRDFSEHGAGGDDAGMCLLGDKLIYSVYFGNRDPSGVTAALDPRTGRTLWKTTKYALHAGCTVSGEAGRVYLGGYNPVEGKVNRVWCLDARDGSLLWKSEPLHRAIHVVTIGERFLFTHSQYENGVLIDKANGKILARLTEGYRCTRFVLSGSTLLGPDLDLWDVAKPDACRLVSTGPAIDVLLCVGAIPANGRLFYTANGGGLQASLQYGEEAKPATTAPGRR